MIVRIRSGRPASLRRDNRKGIFIASIFKCVRISGRRFLQEYVAAS